MESEMKLILVSYLLVSVASHLWMRTLIAFAPVLDEELPSY
jgi:hypothetical protein